MCGKFTALASCSELVAFFQPLTESGGGEGPSGDEGSNDEIVTCSVGALLPVIVWDAEARARRALAAKMRHQPVSTCYLGFCSRSVGPITTALIGHHEHLSGFAV